MSDWESDIAEHRRLVAYYMNDFVSMTKPDAARGWGDLYAATVPANNLYRIAQHCAARRGIPDYLSIIATCGTGMVAILRNTSTVDLENISARLSARAEVHDLSKFHTPERETFKVFTPRLKTFRYGSDEYKRALADMGEGLRHHYAVNSHHPEFHPRGVADMSLLDVIEMFCDWVAACDQRRFELDIDKQVGRFEIHIHTPRLGDVLTDTRDVLRQWHQEHNCPSYF